MTIQESADELVSDLALFDSKNDFLDYLIDLGHELPPLAEAQKTDENKVHGCVANVWIVAQKCADGTIDFVADTEGIIQRGVIGLLHKIYGNRTPREILDFDINAFLQRLDLGSLLSMGRRNGLDGMIARIKNLASQNA